jgi:hypothetical protein
LTLGDQRMAATGAARLQAVSCRAGVPYAWTMFGWLVRIVLAAAGIVTGWFVAADAPNFGVVQGIVAVSLIAFLVLIFALGRGRR